jgi:hypothetical protein
VIDTRKIGTGQPFSGTLNPPVDVVTSRATFQLLRRRSSSTRRWCRRRA